MSAIIIPGQEPHTPRAILLPGEEPPPEAEYILFLPADSDEVVVIKAPGQPERWP